MNRLRVFLCDDDRDIVEVTRLVLEQYYDVDVFFISTDIVASAEELQPCVILLDLWMPDVGGEITARELRKNPATRDIPIILFSASNNLSKIANDTMVNAFIAKPYDIDAMLDTIAQVIGIAAENDDAKK